MPPSFNQDTNVLVLGGGGMLGEAVYHLLKSRCTLIPTDIDLNECWLTYLDVRDPTGLRITFETIKPKVVLHLAALVDLEEAERDPDSAYLTNESGTANVARLCRQFGSLMIYISTAGIFDGSQDIFTDDDAPSPLSVYGRSKYAGELTICQMLEKYFIFRAGWMMGGGPRKDKKFVNKIIKQLRSGARELYAVDDKWGSPTYTYDFVENLVRVVETGRYGVYNMVSRGRANRWHVTNEIIRILGLKSSIPVYAVNSNFWEAEYFAPRPRSEQLENSKLNALGLNGMKHWKDNLETYLKQHRWEVDRLTEIGTT